MIKRAVFIILLSLVSACTLFGGKEDPTENMTAEQLYNQARGAMGSGDYDKAIEYYEKLEGRFPFGVYGQQALLDLAYVHYKSNDPDASISAAERFIKLYPQNRHVDYAYYIKGLANYNRGWTFTKRFLPLDETQRDSSSAAFAFQDFAELVRLFPDSIYADDAKQRMVYLRNTLAEHEINVANYYLRRGAFIAAANRATYVIEKYPRTPSVPEALVIMARSYKILEMNELAEDALRILELNYPNHPGLFEVRQIVVR